MVTPEPTIAGGVPRSEDQELGVKVGSFYLYPQIELNAGYDSNVFAQNCDARRDDLSETGRARRSACGSACFAMHAACCSVMGSALALEK